MNNKRKQSGLTLTELVVTIAIAAILMAVAVPAAKRLAESLSHSAGAYGLISAALSNARAIATSQGKYAGLRFQQAADGRTYIIFIIHDEPANMGGLANGFRVVDGRKPIALPEEMGAIAGYGYANADLETVKGWNNANTFSIVFNSAGKLVIHPVRVRNKHGQINDSSKDAIFNTKVNVDDKDKPGIFYQDDYLDAGYYQEDSINSLRIYNKKQLAEVNLAQRWSAYLSTINPIMVSPYTGELLGGDQN